MSFTSILSILLFSQTSNSDWIWIWFCLCRKHIYNLDIANIHANSPHQRWNSHCLVSLFSCYATATVFNSVAKYFHVGSKIIGTILFAITDVKFYSIFSDTIWLSYQVQLLHYFQWISWSKLCTIFDSHAFIFLYFNWGLYER